MRVSRTTCCMLLDRAIIGALFLLALVLLGVDAAHADLEPVARLFSLLR